MKRPKYVALCLAALMTVSTIFTGCGEKENSDKVTITNVSYDPTREFYSEYDKMFSDYWQEKTGKAVEVTASHGGSGSQARSVIEGNEADVVTLALAHDITAIQDAGLIEKGWMEEMESNSSPYTSTIVFLVRKGNEKNIKDWDDLVRDEVEVITPNPKTSGGACWNFLAAWAYASQALDGDDAKIQDFMKKLYGNVLVLDSGARGSTNTFVENKQGDVLIAWENEAFLAMEEHPDEFEMVTPGISILAEPSVAVVDSVTKARGTEEVAREYLENLYSDEAQRLAGKHYYRPSDPEILQEYSDQFDLNMNLVSIDDFGGWDEAYKTYFADHAIFDQIYQQ